MLRILSDFNDIIRFDVDADDVLINSGVAETGTWAVKRGDTLGLPTAGDRDAMAILTGSNRDGTAGWSPDATSNGKQQLTVAWGKFRAYTDQYVGTPAAGDALAVNADGQLAVAALTAGTAVAVCIKAEHAYSGVSDNQIYDGKTVIEILTL